MFSVRLWKATPPTVQLDQDVDEVPQRPAEAVEAPDDDGVAGADLLEQPIEG